jgi:hypothetical protein
MTNSEKITHLSDMKHIADLRAQACKAFVEGARWWHWYTTQSTLFPSEVHAATEEAQKRYPFKGLKERELEIELTGAQERVKELEEVVLDFLRFPSWKAISPSV